ncbi:MAG: hypothetical protein V4700_00890 [Pseudomonadota bacterium]
MDKESSSWWVTVAGGKALLERLKNLQHGIGLLLSARENFAKVILFKA